MRFFTKTSGLVFEYNPLVHDIDDLKNRFTECNADGSELKPKPKPKPQPKKKEE